MDIVDAVLRLIDTIGNWFWLLLNRLVSFFQSVVEIIWYWVSVFKTIFYWIGSLLGSVYDLFKEIIGGSVIVNVWKAFWDLASYIWWPAVVFISSLLLVVIIRILIAFVFKILRLNIDYNSFDKQTRKANSWDNASEYRKKTATRL